MWVWQRVVQRHSLHKQIGSRVITSLHPFFQTETTTNDTRTCGGPTVTLRIWDSHWDCHLEGFLDFSSISMPTQFQFDSLFNSWLFSLPFDLCQKYHVLRFVLGDLGGSWRQNLQLHVRSMMSVWLDDQIYVFATVASIILARWYCWSFSWLNDWALGATCSDPQKCQAIRFKSAKKIFAVFCVLQEPACFCQETIDWESGNASFLNHPFSWGPSETLPLQLRGLYPKSPPVCFLMHLLSFL